MEMNHYELLPASKYYGKHATGFVVLVNGHCYFHGTKSEAKAFYNTVTR